MIFKLSPLLGGRSEVLKLSLLEALGHMCILKDEEEAKEKREHADRYFSFISKLYSHPPESLNEKMRKGQTEFFEELRSKLPSAPTPQFDWDFSIIEENTKEQMKGAK